MASKLSLYNGALRLLGERKLASLTENREPRRVLDDAWDSDALRYCLEQGLWNFATRTVELTYSPSVDPDFGYQYAFDKPTDFVRLVGISLDEYFASPFNSWTDEAGFWFCDNDTIYVRYVSDDASYGADYSLWPETFAKYVEGFLAMEVAPRILQNAAKEDKIDKMLRKLLTDARSKDAMNEPTKFLPPGSWSRSRAGKRGVFTNRGNGFSA